MYIQCSRISVNNDGLCGRNCDSFISGRTIRAWTNDLYASAVLSPSFVHCSMQLAEDSRLTRPSVPSGTQMKQRRLPERDVRACNARH